MEQSLRNLERFLAPFGFLARFPPSSLSVKEFPALHEEIDRPGVFSLLIGHVTDGGAGHHHPRRTVPLLRARYTSQSERIRHPGTDLDGLRIFSIQPVLVDVFRGGMFQPNLQETLPELQLVVDLVQADGKAVCRDRGPNKSPSFS